MAIAFDASSTKYQAGNSTITQAHTVTGSNTLLMVGINGNNSTSYTVTYNGTSMTLLTSSNNTDSFSNTKSWLFYLINPSVGANNIVVTCSGPPTDTSLSAASYTGVDQTTALGSAFSATFNNSSAPSLDVTGVNSGELVFNYVGTLGNCSTGTAGGGASERGKIFNASSSLASDLASSGTVTMSWTLGASKWGNTIGVAMKPVASNPVVALSSVWGLIIN